MRLKRRLLALVLAGAMTSSSLFAGNISYAYDQPEINKALGLIYETQKVKLQGIKIKKDTTEGELINDELSFTIFDATIQEFLDRDLRSRNGVLLPIDIIKGHHYIIWLNPNSKYHMKKFGGNGSTKRYITLDSDVVINSSDIGGVYETLPKNDKSKFDSNDPNRTPMCCLVLEDGATTEDTERIPIGKSDSGTGLELVENDGGYGFNISEGDLGSGVKVKLVNQYDEVVLNRSGDWYYANVIEDLNYAVVVEGNSRYVPISTLVTTKDHSEQNDEHGHPAPTRTYTHYTCNSVSAIYMLNTRTNNIASYQYPAFTSRSGKSSLEGVVAYIEGGVKINSSENRGGSEQAENEFLFVENERKDISVDELKDYDYDVIDFDTVNMHRYEICKLPYGDYTITTKIDNGKAVKSVYYIDNNGKLQPCEIIGQNENTLKFKSTSVGCYNNVIVYGGKIEYRLNGGDNDKSNPTYYDGSKDVSLISPTKEGYTFEGWYTDANFTTKVEMIKKGEAGDKELFAKWAINKYKITFDKNKGTGKTKEMSVAYGKTVKLTKNKFSRKGYTFVGWNTKANGKGDSYKNQQKILNLSEKNGGKVTLYAQWVKNTKKFSVKYQLNGGKNNKSNIKRFTVVTKTTKLKNPTKKGYVFKGWYSDKKFKNKVTKITKGSHKNITLYAKWVKK